MQNKVLLVMKTLENCFDMNKPQPHRGFARSGVHCALEDVLPSSPLQISSVGRVSKSKVFFFFQTKRGESQTMSAAEPWMTALTAWRSERVR